MSSDLNEPLGSFPTEPQAPQGGLPWHRDAAGIIPPPPPPPPHFGVHGAPMWQMPPPPAQRRGGRRVLASALAAIFLVGIGSGVAAARLTSPPAGTTATLTPTLPADTGSGSAATGGGGAPSTGAADTSGVAGLVTPGIVNINVALSGNGGAAGTGMLITSTGEVLTNNHVIDGETSLTVELPSTGQSYSAHVVGYDLTDDVALVQIDGGGTFRTVNIGNSSTVGVGDAVVALGNALGRNGAPSVTTGHVTALDRTITASDQSGGDAETVSGLIQVDAPIQPGDSGGPLVTSTGVVIGMDTAAQATGQSDEQTSSVAYAIPINKAMSVVKQIQSGQSTSTVRVGNTRALLGVGGQDAQNGVRVVTVQGGSAAASAGITVGSVITALDGRAVATNSGLRQAIITHEAGQSVSVTWTDSGGQSHTATVTLGVGPPA